VPGLTGTRAVDLATVPGCAATSASGTRTTGKAYLVSLPADYATFAPGEVRRLLGASTGVLLQQQTAATLAATVGDTVSILGGPGVKGRRHCRPSRRRLFFQVVGAPPARRHRPARQRPGRSASSFAAPPRE